MSECLQHVRTFKNECCYKLRFHFTYLKAGIISGHKFYRFGGLMYLAGIHFNVFKIIGMFFSFITGKIERRTNFSGHLI